MRKSCQVEERTDPGLLLVPGDNAGVHCQPSRPSLRQRASSGKLAAFWNREDLGGV